MERAKARPDAVSEFTFRRNEIEYLCQLVLETSLLKLTAVDRRTSQIYTYQQREAVCSDSAESAKLSLPVSAVYSLLRVESDDCPCASPSRTGATIDWPSISHPADSFVVVLHLSAYVPRLCLKFCSTPRISSEYLQDVIIPGLTKRISALEHFLLDRVLLQVWQSDWIPLRKSTIRQPNGRHTLLIPYPDSLTDPYLVQLKLRMGGQKREYTVALPFKDPALDVPPDDALVFQWFRQSDPGGRNVYKNVNDADRMFLGPIILRRDVSSFEVTIETDTEPTAEKEISILGLFA